MDVKANSCKLKRSPTSYHFSKGPSLSRQITVVLHSLDYFIVVCFFFRVIIIRKRPTLLKLLYGLAVVIGLFVCLIPTIFPGVDPKAEKTKTETHGVSRVMWPIIFMLGFVSILCIQPIS